MERLDTQGVKLALLTAVLSSLLPTLGMVWTGAQFVERSNQTQKQMEEVIDKIEAIEDTISRDKLARTKEMGSFENRFVRIEEAFKFLRGNRSNVVRNANVSDSNGG